MEELGFFTIFFFLCLFFELVDKYCFYLICSNLLFVYWFVWFWFYYLVFSKWILNVKGNKIKWNCHDIFCTKSYLWDFPEGSWQITKTVLPYKREVQETIRFTWYVNANDFHRRSCQIWRQASLPGLNFHLNIVVNIRKMYAVWEVLERCQCLSSPKHVSMYQSLCYFALWNWATMFSYSLSPCLIGISYWVTYFMAVQLFT